MIIVKNGSLLDATERIIAHQVNCFGTIGGLAYSLFKQFPKARADYLHMVSTNEPDELLGGMVVTYEKEHIIVSLFGQCEPGPHTDYCALKDSFERLSLLAITKGGGIVALPYGMGAGIGGGDWYTIKLTMDDCMDGILTVLYRLQQN